MLSIFLLIPLSLMLFVVAIWAVRYAVKSNQFEDLDNASQRIILEDRQERRQVLQAHERAAKEGDDVDRIDSLNDTTNSTSQKSLDNDLNNQLDDTNNSKL